MAPAWNWELELPPGILVAIDPALDHEQARDKMADFLNAFDELAAQHGIMLEPDWQFELHEVG
jgi:hypothetical protein